MQGGSPKHLPKHKNQIELQLWSKQCPEREIMWRKCLPEKGFLGLLTLPKVYFLWHQNGCRNLPCNENEMNWVQVLQWINFFGVSNRVRQLPPLATGRSLQKIFGGPLASVRLPTSSESGSLLPLESSWWLGTTANMETWKPKRVFEDKIGGVPPWSLETNLAL